VAKELLKADGTIRDLIGADGDFKPISAEFTPMKDDDYATAQQDIVFEAVFHSNAGVWGYSYWSEFVWG